MLIDVTASYPSIQAHKDTKEGTQLCNQTALTEPFFYIHKKL